MRLLITFLLSGCSITASYAQYFDTLHIRYAIGEAVLLRPDKKILDSIAGSIGNRKILIYSYADYLGSEQRNQHLSDKRATEVKNYLLQRGIGKEQVMECTGLGKIPGTGGTAGDPENRRTDIFIRKSAVPVVVAEKPKPAPAKIPSRPKPSVKPATEGIPVKPDEESAEPKVTKIDIDNLKVDDVIRLENITFFPGKSTIRPVSYQEMENLYNVMYDHPNLKIKLEGHVCCCIYPDGYFDDTPTWGLSVERAYVVYKHLIDRGIAPERMQYEGFGRTRPINKDEKTSEEGQVNRRVEVRILAK